MNAKNQKRLLIIDDHEAVRALLNVFFKRDYEVEVKRDGLEALAWLSAGHLPDVILLDMEMPRLNGAEFLRQIRASGLFANIPVIIVTASEAAEAKKEVLTLGVAGFVTKPFDPMAIRAKVAEIIELGLKNWSISQSEQQHIHLPLDSAI